MSGPCKSNLQPMPTGTRDLTASLKNIGETFLASSIKLGSSVLWITILKYVYVGWKVEIVSLLNLGLVKASSRQHFANCF